MKFHTPKRVGIAMQIKLEDIAASAGAFKENAPEISAFPHYIQGINIYFFRVVITEYNLKMVFIE